MADPADDTFMRAEWDRRSAAAAGAPLHVTRYRAGTLAMLLEILAADRSADRSDH